MKKLKGARNRFFVRVTRCNFIDIWRESYQLPGANDLSRRWKFHDKVFGRLLLLEIDSYFWLCCRVRRTLERFIRKLNTDTHFCENRSLLYSHSTYSWKYSLLHFPNWHNLTTLQSKWRLPGSANVVMSDEIQKRVILCIVVDVYINALWWRLSCCANWTGNLFLF